MIPSELFDLWAPPGGLWSPWAKPVLFAELGAVAPVDLYAEPLPSVSLAPSPRAALVVDLPGASSVKAGLALLNAGFRPVPLYNGNRGPGVLNLSSGAVIDNEPILGWLCAGAALLQGQPLPSEAPPAFLLDSRRRSRIPPAPGRFDNRWIVFPQDFPSASFLASQAIERAVLLQEDIQAQPQEDLAHVLRRWQQAGIPIFVGGVTSAGSAQPLTVDPPKRFGWLWYRALALMGLRRNSAGGFGSVVPQPSSGAG